MLSLLLKKAAKVVTLLIMAALLLMGSATTTYANTDYQAPTNQIVQQAEHVQVVVRVGEYEGKPGKRVYINGETVNIPNDIPIRNDRDGKGFYISEFDINLKVAKKVVRQLEEAGVTCKLQVANGKSEDLNRAGRIANQSKPEIYLSIHHNSFQADSSGYFSMYNPGDVKSKQLADNISNALRNNGKIRQCQNRINDGYIGELNVLDKNITAVLVELGYFSNIKELEVICSDHQTYYYAKYISQEIIKKLGM